MKFNIDNLDFKKYCNYSDNELAKAYVLYSIKCQRELSCQEWDILYHAVFKFTLRKNRLWIHRMWQNGDTIYFTGKQSHDYGYSWDEEVLSAFYPIFNSLAD